MVKGKLGESFIHVWGAVSPPPTVKGFVVSSGGAPTPAGTSVFTKHNWDLMGGAFIT